ncbi:MAG TPA: DUF1330 domain-containing protein [Acidimicrobiales bacterium]
MPAYVIVEIDVHDTEAYGPYAEGATTSVAASGGRYLARGGRTESLEGDAPRPRVVVLTFPDFDAAVAWYHSDAYQAVAPIRHAAAASRMFVVDGVPGG